MPRVAWDQLVDEPDDAYDLFLRYLDHPKDSVADFVRAHGLSYPTTVALSVRHRWKGRRHVFRVRMVGVKIAATERAAEEDGAALALALTAAHDLVLRSMLELNSAGAVLAPKDLIPLVKFLSDREAVAAGRPTERIEISVEDALKRVEGLAARARARAEAPDED